MVNRDDFLKRFWRNIAWSFRLFILTETSRVVEKKFPDQLGFWDRQLSQMSFELVYTPEDFSQLDLPQIRDENDLPILASAVICQPDLIVTGDKDFKSREVQEYFAIYTPGEFLRFFESEDGPMSSSPRRCSSFFVILQSRKFWSDEGLVMGKAGGSVELINKLLELFEREKLRSPLKRGIVFWYDDEAEGRDLGEIRDVLGEQEIQVRELKEDNAFQIKYLLEMEQPETSFLLYAPFARPEPEGNRLLDILLYSAEFKTDETALLAEELGLDPNQARSFLQRTSYFFGKNGGRKSFAGCCPCREKKGIGRRRSLLYWPRLKVPNRQMCFARFLGKS